jgi:phosphinothricin acetyltransferase
LNDRVPARLVARLAVRADTPAIAAIYNQGIEDRVATFETEPRTVEQVEAWFGGRHPVVVAEAEAQVVAFASTSTYRARRCYDGVAEFSIYVERTWRGRGAGRAVLERLTVEAEKAGLWKLVSRVFPENAQSLALLARLGFRQVGTYRNHARLDGRWRDVVIVERLIEANLT